MTEFLNEQSQQAENAFTNMFSKYLNTTLKTAPFCRKSVRAFRQTDTPVSSGRLPRNVPKRGEVSLGKVYEKVVKHGGVKHSNPCTVIKSVSIRIGT